MRKFREKKNHDLVYLWGLVKESVLSNWPCGLIEIWKPHTTIISYSRSSRLVKY